MRKILVCGSAGFLMSNLMRYMLYRTKDYEFASIDPLRREEDQRNVYMHKKHSFHVGDAGDPDFLDRVMRVENPDLVIVGTGTPKPVCSNGATVEDIVLPTAATCDLCRIRGHRIIRLVPDIDVIDMGSRPMWSYVESMVSEVGGTTLRLPNCFGRRGQGIFEQALRKILLGQAVDGWKPDAEKRRYAYAEDVASMLWFIIESRDLPQASMLDIVKMPALGYASVAEMVEMAYPVLGWESDNVAIVEQHMEKCALPGWIPDSKDMTDAVLRTAKWYAMNKWIFDI
jgi:nucleoside-diphosphate-sugar epimerase